MPEGTDIVNCAGKIVAPGLIDMRAFVGEPGASHRETFASASQAAAAGGITTIICQPDTSPVIDNSATVDFVLRRARDTAIVNIHPMAALTKGMRGEEMTEIGLLKAAGAVAFTDGDRSVTNAQVMRRALTYARDFDALIVHHTEDPDLVGEGVMNEGEFAARLGLVGIPNAAEAVMLERDMRLVALTGGRYHAASLSCDRVAGNPQARARRRACGQRLGLDQSCDAERKRYRPLSHVPETVAAAAHRGGPSGAGRSPRLRPDRRRDVRSQSAGRRGEAAAVRGSGFRRGRPADHAAGGLRLIHNGEMDFKTLIRAMSTRPAELLGLPGGTLRAGSPADVIVIDPDTPWVLDPADLKSQCKNTPFDEARFSGRVVRTIVGGRTVYEHV